MATVFETVTCSRCGGSGRYSYNQIDGDRCFKCHGNKVTYTKRGAEANRFYQDSMKVTLGSLVIGDLLHIDDVIMGRRYFAPVTEITEVRQRGASLKDGVMVPYDIPGLQVQTEHPKYGRSGLQAGHDYMVRKGWDAATKQTKRDAAVAYQLTLTQSGTVIKRKAK